MSLTSGFFNSVNSDRLYSAEQFSELFNGIINDGVFANIGKAFAVTANSGNDILVDTGRAWFNGIWINNDAEMAVTLPTAEKVQARIDAVIFEVNKNSAARTASITVKSGTPDSTSPKNPEMTQADSVYQYPIAYIYRAANSTEITQSNITMAVGTSACPYVTGILEVISNDAIVAQWEDEFRTWFNTLSDILTGDPDNLAALLTAHLANTNNPHNVTAAQVGIEYGDKLPEAGTKGRIFFLKV